MHHIEDTQKMSDTIPSGSSIMGQQEVTDSLTSASTANPFLNYFGPPTGPIQTNPYDKFGYTNFDLPEAYKGRNMFLRDTIDGFILEDNTWYTSVCLPYVKTDEHHFAWNEWHFDTHLVGRVPEEGISRMIRSSKRSFKESTVRRGIAFTLEHGFMNTPEGRQQYVMNLRQIQQSVQETANHDVIAALLTCRRYDREWEKKHGMYQRNFAQIMKREVNQWAIAQKNPNGLDYLHEEFKTRLGRWKVTPNMWIFPPKLCLYLTMVPPEKTKFMEVGSEGPAKFNAGAQALTNFRGVHVYETREFDVYEGDLPIDLLRREQQIGEYNVMTDPYRYVHDEETMRKYRSEHRDVVVYDEDRDTWGRVKFEEALANIGRDNGAGFGNVPGSAPVDDVFTDADGKRIQFFAQMQEKYLDDEMIRKIAMTMQDVDFEGIASIYDSFGGSGAIKMFRKQSGGGTGLTVASVGALVVSSGVDANASFVSDIHSRLQNLEDQQRFLHGLRNALSVKADIKSNKNLYKAMVKKAPKGQAEVREWLSQSPFWDADVDTSSLSQGEEWVATSEVWHPKYANDPNWRAGDPATNYTTPSNVAYTPSNRWEDQPWSVAAQNRGGQGTVSQAARPNRGGDFGRYNAGGDMDDILGIGASARFDKLARVGVGRCQDGGGEVQSVEELVRQGPARERWNRFGGNNKAREFLSMCASADSLVALAKKNVWLPFNVVLLRPKMTYDMCSAVLMKGGMETGLSAVGHNDFQLGDDVASKMHYGHYTFKSKAFVQQPRNIIIAENVFAQGYKRGTNNIEMTTYDDDVLGSSKKGSMHVWLTSYNQTNFPSPISLTGSFDDDPPGTQHIEGAGQYHQKWRNTQDLRDPAQIMDPEKEFLENTMNERNTVCYQGHQFTYDVKSGHHDRVTRNTGHWGPNVYPGCGVVRAGEAQHLRDMNYVDCVI